MKCCCETRMSVLYLKLSGISVWRENNTCYLGKKHVKLADLNGIELTKTLGSIKYILSWIKQLY